MKEDSGYSFGVIVIVAVSIEHPQSVLVKVTLPGTSALNVIVSNPLLIPELTTDIVSDGVPGAAVI